MKKIDTINITPLVDILLVLIVILILIIPSFSKVIQVNVPSAKETKNLVDKKIVQIDIHQNGYIYYNNSIMSLSDLSKLPKSKKITLAIDKNTTYNQLSPILERLNILGFEELDFMVK